MQGKVMGDSLVIVDSFALPVQGTETRVNAASEANEYMVQYVSGSEKVSPSTVHIRTTDTAQLVYRPRGWRMRSDGIIHIQGMGAGYQA